MSFPANHARLWPGLLGLALLLSTSSLLAQSQRSRADVDQPTADATSLPLKARSIEGDDVYAIDAGAARFVLDPDSRAGTRLELGDGTCVLGPLDRLTITAPEGAELWSEEARPVTGLSDGRRMIYEETFPRFGASETLRATEDGLEHALLMSTAPDAIVALGGVRASVGVRTRGSLRVPRGWSLDRSTDGQRLILLDDRRAPRATIDAIVLDRPAEWWDPRSRAPAQIDAEPIREDGRYELVVTAPLGEALDRGAEVRLSITQLDADTSDELDEAAFMSGYVATELMSAAPAADTATAVRAGADRTSCPSHVAGEYEVTMRGVGCLDSINPVPPDLFSAVLTLHADCSYTGTLSSSLFDIEDEPVPPGSWEVVGSTLKVHMPGGTFETTITTPISFSMRITYFRPDLRDRVFGDPSIRQAAESVCGTVDRFLDGLRLDWERRSGPRPPEEPENDLCANAIPFPSIPLGSGRLTGGSTVGATVETAAAGHTCGTSITAPGVWYTVLGTGRELIAHFCEESLPASFDTKLSIFRGACASLECVDGNDDSCGRGARVTWCSERGVTYYVLVHGYGDQTGGFNLTIRDGEECGPAETPDIEVRRGSPQATLGPEVALHGSHDLGSATPGDAGLDAWFQIVNSGTADLQIGRVISSDEMRFPIIVQPDATIPPGGRSAFLVRMLAGDPGTREAIIRVYSSDPDENPYVFTLSGTIAPPPASFEARVGPTRLADGDTHDFGTIPLGTPMYRAVEFINGGDERLLLGELRKQGGSLPDTRAFEINRQPSRVVGPGSISHATIEMRASQVGTFRLGFEIEHNGTSPSPFRFYLRVTVEGRQVDLDGNGVVNMHDAIEWMGSREDLNGDRSIDNRDLLAIVREAGLDPSSYGSAKDWKRRVKSEIKRLKESIKSDGKRAIQNMKSDFKSELSDLKRQARSGAISKQEYKSLARSAESDYRSSTSREKGQMKSLTRALGELARMLLGLWPAPEP